MAARSTQPLGQALEEAQAGPPAPITTAGVAVARQQPTNVADALKTSKAAISRALPDGFTGGAERFARLVLTAVRLEPKLNQCTPMSVLGAAMQAAQLGLEPGVLGQAWLIPYRNRDTGHLEASFQLGWRGLVALAGRSGFLLSGGAVRPGDVFDYELGIHQRLRHVPDPYIEGDRPGELWWSIARDRETSVVAAIAVLNRAQVEKRRKASKSPDSPAWRNWYDEMALGKAAREACRFLPLSVEMGAAIASDGTVRVELEGRPDDYPSDADVLEVDSEEVAPS